VAEDDYVEHASQGCEEQVNPLEEREVVQEHLEVMNAITSALMYQWSPKFSLRSFTVSILTALSKSL